jgi:hypothetical protein
MFDSPDGKVPGHKLMQTREELETQIAEQKIETIDSETSKWYVQELGALLDEGSVAERRAFLKSFIKEIRVTPALRSY